MPASLDLLIGLSFIFLLFSLVVTALNELILSKLDLRAKFLQEGLCELLSNEELVRKLCSHGLVNSLSRSGQFDLSYIGAQTFASALIDITGPASVDKIRSIQDVLDGIKELPEGTLKQSLTTLMDEAGRDISKYRELLEAWYCHSMERVTGWYKRQAQQWTFILALTLAIFCNIDAIRISQALYGDPVLHKAVLAQAQNYVVNSSKGDSRSTSPLSYDNAVNF